MTLSGATANQTLNLVSVADTYCSQNLSGSSTVIVNALPACSITGLDGPVCPSSSNNYTAPVGMTTYLWSISDNGSIPGATNQQNVSVTAGSNCNQSFTLTLVITDGNGCSSSCQKIVSVTDNTAPTLTGTAYAGTTGTNACMADAATAAPFSAADAIQGYTDNCGGAVTAELTDTQVTGTDCAWTVEYTFKVVDGCGNELTGQTYSNTGGDKTAPTLASGMSWPADVTGIEACKSVNAAGATEAEIAALYEDNCGATVVVTKTVHTALSGDDCSWSITYNYNISDGCNSVDNQITYSGGNKNLPEISLIGESTVLVCVGKAYTEEGATASDHCGTDISGSISIVSNVNTSIAGNYSVTYNVTDGCGNSALEVTRTVIVQPTPVVSSTVTGPGGTILMSSGNTYYLTICSGEEVTTSAPVSSSVDPSACGPLRIQTKYTTDLSNLPPSMTLDELYSVVSLIDPLSITPENHDGVAKDIVFVSTPYYDVDNNESMTEGDVVGEPVTFILTVDPEPIQPEWNADITANSTTVTMYSSATDPYTGTICSGDAVVIGVPVITSAGGDLTGICGAALRVRLSFTSTLPNIPASYMDVTYAEAQTMGAQTITPENHTGLTQTLTFTGTVYYGDWDTKTLFSEVQAVLTVESELTLECTDIAVENDPGVCGASVEFEAIASGTPTPEITYWIGTTPITSGHLFPVGKTTVEVVAENECMTVSCTFTVTVTDTEDPVFATFPANINDAAGTSCQYYALWNAPTATDNCVTNPVITGQHYSYVPAPGVDPESPYSSLYLTGSNHSGFFEIGTHVIRYTVTDGEQTTFQDLTITVEDMTAPYYVTACPDNLSVDNDPGLDGAVLVPGVDFIPPVFGENCSTPMTSGNDLPGENFFPVGTTTVNYWASDAAGNLRTCTFLVEVKDIEPPVITILGDNPATVNVGATYTDAGATAWDNVDGDLTAEIIVSGSVDTSVEGVYFITYSVTDNAGNTATKVRTVNVLGGGSVSGTYKYLHSKLTPLAGVTVKLQQSGITVHETVTDADGNYAFSAVLPGDYTVVSSYDYPTGGAINAIDAGMLNAWQVGPQYAIEKVRFKAGDVLAPINRITSGDPGRINQYFLNDGNPAWNAPVELWSFWKAGETTINKVISDPSYPVITVGTTAVLQDFYGLITGDFNLSATDQINALKSGNSGSVTLLDGSTMGVTPDGVFSVPLTAQSAMTVGAISLIMEYPVDRVEVLGVFLGNDQTVPVPWNLVNNQLRIGWYSQEALKLASNETLINLKVKVKSGATQGEKLRFSLAHSSLNELGDDKMEVIPDVQLIAAVLEVIATNSVFTDLNGGVDLLMYPNPASETVHLSYSVPQQVEVTIEAFDMLGKKMGVLLDEVRNEGKHDLKVDVAMWTPGIYFVKLNLGTGSSSVSLIKKLVIQ